MGGVRLVLADDSPATLPYIQSGSTGCGLSREGELGRDLDDSDGLGPE